MCRFLQLYLNAQLFRWMSFMYFECWTVQVDVFCSLWEQVSKCLVIYLFKAWIIARSAKQSTKSSEDCLDFQLTKTIPPTESFFCSFSVTPRVGAPRLLVLILNNDFPVLDYYVLNKITNMCKSFIKFHEYEKKKFIACFWCHKSLKIGGDGIWSIEMRQNFSVPPRQICKQVRLLQNCDFCSKLCL